MSASSIGNAHFGQHPVRNTERKDAKLLIFIIVHPHLVVCFDEWKQSTGSSLEQMVEGCTLFKVYENKSWKLTQWPSTSIKNVFTYKVLIMLNIPSKTITFLATLNLMQSRSSEEICVISSRSPLRCFSANWKI